MEYAILDHNSDELWRGSDGFALRFPSKDEALQYAKEHISKNENEYDIIEY